MKKYILLLLIISFMSGIFPLYSYHDKGVLFRFKQRAGDKFVVSGQTTVDFYRDNVLKVKTGSEWMSVNKALGRTRNGLRFNYVFQSKKKSGKVSTGTGTYIRNYLGNMYFNETAFYPQSTGTPAFPNYRIKKLHYWEKPGQEVINFKNLGIRNPYRLKFNARYRYLKDQIINGRKHAVIQCFYVVNKNLNRQIHVPGYSRLRPRYFMPTRLIGKYERFFYWDIEKGYWTKMTARINFLLSFTNAIHVEWKSLVIAKQAKK